jgi:serine/threonine protein kinase, bacterial
VRTRDAIALSQQYVLGRQIGAGGFGEVYAATDSYTGTPVAIKFYRAQAHEALTGALKARTLSHPNVVPVLEAGELGGTSYLVMPLIKGRSLADHLADGVLTPRETINLLEGIAAALDELHAAGIVHGDIKPSNIMVTDEPVTHAMLLDFGSIPTVDEDAVGRFVGTPAYAAPEHVSERSADAPADIYALTAVLAECITATRLFSRPTYAETVRAHLVRKTPLIEPDNPVARALTPVLEKGLDINPNGRYVRASELIDAARTVLYELRPELLDEPLALARPQEPAPTTVRS